MNSLQREGVEDVDVVIVVYPLVVSRLDPIGRCQMDCRHCVAAVDSRYTLGVDRVVHQPVVIRPSPHHEVGHVVPVQPPAGVDEVILRIILKQLSPCRHCTNFVIRTQHLVRKVHIQPLADEQHSFHLPEREVRAPSRLDSLGRLEEIFGEDDVTVGVAVKHETVHLRALVLMCDVVVHVVQQGSPRAVRLEPVDHLDPVHLRLHRPLGRVGEQIRLEPLARQPRKRSQSVLLGHLLPRVPVVHERSHQRDKNLARIDLHSHLVDRRLTLKKVWGRV
mmetsp:Transcript_14752/g.50314  ORF Transcript_14752/g.50314 Transcript_14752/m.50314 type:complete len:277 (-) Transcript_14752:868-1698(-)